jgi:hypothetical protein
MERRAGADPDRPADSLAHSVQILQTSAEDASQRLHHLTTHLGLTIEFDAGGDAGEERRTRELDADPLTRDATRYCVLVHDWLGAESGPLLAHVTALGASGLAPERVAEEIFELREHLTVVTHDHWLIASKARRAVVGMLLRRDLEKAAAETAGAAVESRGRPSSNPPRAFFAAGDMQRDEDGSAKVALLALDRSMDAWCAVAARYPDGAPSVSLIVDWLVRLRTQLEARFPHARAFRRPGFDTSERGSREVE